MKGVSLQTISTFCMGALICMPPHQWYWIVAGIFFMLATIAFGVQKARRAKQYRAALVKLEALTGKNYRSED